MSSKVEHQGQQIPTRVNLNTAEAKALWEMSKRTGFSMNRVVGDLIRAAEKQERNEGINEPHHPARTKQQ